jgi:hypothetical protein
MKVNGTTIYVVSVVVIQQRSGRLALTPLQVVKQGIVCCLWLVIAIEEEWVIIGSPAVLVRDSPDSDTDTLGDLETGVHDSEVVVGGSTSNVELGNSNFFNVGGSDSP